MQCLFLKILTCNISFIYCQEPNSQTTAFTIITCTASNLINTPTFSLQQHKCHIVKDGSKQKLRIFLNKHPHYCRSTHNAGNNSNDTTHCLALNSTSLEFISFSSIVYCKTMIFHQLIVTDQTVLIEIEIHFRCKVLQHFSHSIDETSAINAVSEF